MRRSITPRSGCAGSRVRQDTTLGSRARTSVGELERRRRRRGLRAGAEPSRLPSRAPTTLLRAARAHGERHAIEEASVDRTLEPRRYPEPWPGRRPRRCARRSYRREGRNETDRRRHVRPRTVRSRGKSHTRRRRRRPHQGLCAGPSSCCHFSARATATQNSPRAGQALAGPGATLGTPAPPASPSFSSIASAPSCRGSAPTALPARRRAFPSSPLR